MLLYSDMRNYYQQLNYIFQNLQVIVASIGIIGQLLIICVFLRKRLRNHSYALYSIAMFCADIWVCVHSFRHWAAFMFDANIDLVNGFFCAVGEYQPYTAATIALWLLALVSLDRVLTIAYANRFKLFKKGWFQALLVVFFIVYSLLIHIQLPMNYRLTVIDGSNTTVCSIPYNVFNIHTWIYLVNIYLIVIVINNLLSIKMVLFLVNTRKGLNLKQNKRSAIKDRKFALSAIGLNIATMICKLPLSTALLVSSYLTLTPDQMQLLFTICVMVATLDNAAAFGIYMVVNSVFYDEFLIMIGLKNSRIKNTASTSNHSLSTTAK
jgi:hypothetical protein